mmetsp:Transcript_14413/g.54380  ORF Transcript_14413/g.54380 Transcript_14413/m.54380 type:complete len:130 (+) Transcript_14413:585-974(+)|eukprot:scaffold19_cov336-Pinguiococcus_pyrenoidosus.AAC.5
MGGSRISKAVSGDGEKLTQGAQAQAVWRRDSRARSFFDDGQQDDSVANTTFEHAPADPHETRDQQALELLVAPRASDPVADFAQAFAGLVSSSSEDGASSGVPSVSDALLNAIAEVYPRRDRSKRHRTL